MSNSNWTIFIPIYNLEISPDAKGEITVEDVTFISAKKIPHIRKKLGLKYTISSCERSFGKKKTVKLFEKTKVYAVIKSRREMGAPWTREFRRVREAVYLLASSQFYRTKRDWKIPFGGPEYGVDIIDQFSYFENYGDRFGISHTRLTSVSPYRVTKAMLSSKSTHFFPYLLKIINGKISVSDSWRLSLRRAALLAGQSQLARTAWEAFIYDMIALEVLLTKRDDPFPGALVDRVVAFFGWVSNENVEFWRKLIQRLYELRCEFVHDGQVKNLTVRDLIIADMITANLLYNLCRLTAKIKSKNDIIELAKKLNARRILHMKMKERPKRIRFRRVSYFESDFEKLNEEKHWAW